MTMRSSWPMDYEQLLTKRRLLQWPRSIERASSPRLSLGEGWLSAFPRAANWDRSSCSFSSADSSLNLPRRCPIHRRAGYNTTARLLSFLVDGGALLAMSAPAIPSDHVSAYGKASVLIVEDERSIARFMEIELVEAGYQVTIVSDGIDALMQVSQSPPDLVILDLMIPGIDGLEVCRRLRSARGTFHDLPILMVTAKNSVPDRVIGLKTGADDYLTKPFSIEELLASFEALLRRCGGEQA